MMIGYIYIIKSKQTNRVYVGSTVLTLKKRFRLHKLNQDCTSREILKYSDAEIELLECYEYEDDEELELKEAYYIREYKKNNLCVNKKIPRRTKKEYNQEYREENKEKLNEKIECSCGGKYTHKHKSHHFKTKKHLEFLTKQN